MFENSIDQGIDTIRNTTTNTFIKNRKPSSFFLTACLIYSLESSVIYKSHHPRRVPEKPVTSKLNFRLIKIMIILISNTNHRHVTHFIDDFLFRQTINIPFIKLISRNRKLCLKRSLFKLHIRRSGF